MNELLGLPLPDAAATISGLRLLISGFCGVLLGLFFFGGLWWTVRRALASRHTALWILGSQLLRTAVAVVGIYLLAAGSWQYLIATMCGFILVRVLLIRFMPPPNTDKLATGESAHAP